MHAPRQLPKDERQRLVASIVGRRRVGSQHELRAALESAGCAVTQATISRDIRELGLEKTSDVLATSLSDAGIRLRPDAVHAVSRHLGEDAGRGRGGDLVPGER